MPLWTIYHPPSTFTTEASKADLAKAITNIYTQVPMPAFYVNVIFQPIDPASFYIGGVPRPSPHTELNEPCPDSSKALIRITIQNIARKIPDEASRDHFLERVDAALKPYVGDKGYDWEYSVIETSRDLWKINGLVPPMPQSEAEREWTRVNRAVAFEDVRGGLEKTEETL